MTKHHATPAPDGLLALWLPANGGITTVTLPSNPDERSDTLARLVDGMLDVVALDEHTDMWVNDEFLFRWPETPNVMATRVAGAHGYDVQPYHGPAVLTGGVDAHGDTQGLDDTSAHAARLDRLLRRRRRPDPPRRDRRPPLPGDGRPPLLPRRLSTPSPGCPDPAREPASRAGPGPHHPRAAIRTGTTPGEPPMTVDFTARRPG